MVDVILREVPFTQIHKRLATHPEMPELIHTRDICVPKEIFEMGQQKIKRYTVEELQEVSSLSFPKAIQVLDRFGGDPALIDKMMKRLIR